MRLHQQYESDSLDRVQDFFVVNVATLGPLTTSAAAVQLKAAIDQIATQHNQQESANNNMLGQITREQAATEDLRDNHMKPIAIFSREGLKGVPDIAALTKSTHKLRGKQLVAAGRAMATSASPHVGELVKGGFQPDVVTQLATAADTLNTAITDRANTKVARVGATDGIRASLASGRSAVRMLDAVIRKQFAQNPTLLASWRAAKRVIRKAGGVNTPAAPTGAAPTPAVAATVPTVTATVPTTEAKAS